MPSQTLNPPPETPSLPPPPPPPDLLAILPQEPQTSLSASSHNTDETSPNQSPSSQDQPKSFRDTLLVGSATPSPPLVSFEELAEANRTVDSPMVEDGTDPTQMKVPKVKIPKAIWQRLCVPWRNTVIIKLLGKSINFHILHARLLKEWKTEQKYEVIDVGMGYFIVRFATSEDCSRILTGGPYKFFDHYLAVQPWEPSFHPARAKAPKTAVWVKLYGVPSMCFHEAIVRYLASKLGKPIKVDSITLLGTREKFARVCVEVDLSQQLPSSLDLDLEDLPQTMVLVEYEGLHKIYFHCGAFSHAEDLCHYKHPGKPVSMGNSNAQAMIELTQALKPNAFENNMVFGSWMVQHRKPKRQNPIAHTQAPTGALSPAQFTKDSASSQSALGLVVKSKVLDKGKGAKSLQHNHFTVIEDLMEEETELIGVTKGKEEVEAGTSVNLNGCLAAMAIIPSITQEAQQFGLTQQEAGKTLTLQTIPLPAPDSSFIKPKPKSTKRKSKTSGPIPKDTKPSAHKPYDPPPISKKHLDHSLVSLAIPPATEGTPTAPIAQVVPPTLLPMPQTTSTPQILPLIQAPSTKPPRKSTKLNILHAENPPPTSSSDLNLRIMSTPQPTDKVPSLAAIQDSVALSLAPSK